MGHEYSICRPGSAQPTPLASERYLRRCRLVELHKEARCRTVILRLLRPLRLIGAATLTSARFGLAH